MNEHWQVYKKVGSRWETVLEPMSKTEAEAWVTLMWDKINTYDKAVAEAKRLGVKCRAPEPGFREPHCVPV